MGPAIIIPMVMMAAMAAMQFAQAKSQQSATNKNAKEQAKMLAQDANAQYAEANRQEAEVNRVAEEQRSDRVRKAQAELGTLRVIAGENGSGADTFHAMATEIGYNSGLDLSRLEANRKDNIAQAEAHKQAAQLGAKSQLNVVKNQMEAAKQNSKWTAIGGAVKVAGAGASAYAGSFGSDPGAGTKLSDW